MTPPFDLQGGLALTAARTASVTALLSTFGTLGVLALVAPRAFARAQPAEAADLTRRLRRLTWASVAVCLVAMAVWLVVQAGVLADADGLAGAVAAVPLVVSSTLFGHLVAAQMAVLAVLGLVLWLAGGAAGAAFGVASGAVLLQAGHSHAASMYSGPSLLLACDVLHLLAAGGWLGALVPLLVVVRHAPGRVAAEAARRFSPWGRACVVVLAGTALVQGWVLVGSVPGLVGTGYGWMVLAKLALFAVLVGFALANRYRLAPALVTGEPGRARRVLARSLVLQTGAGLAIVAAAAVLSGLPPSMHLQPVWPFAQQIDLDAVREDADVRREVVLAGVALAAGVALLASALLLRRWRLPAAAVAVAVGWFAVPHFGLLLADATPTSFYHSTTGFSADAIVSGGVLFGQNCAVCHGAGGAGDGPAAHGLAVPPANLTAGHVLEHTDGEMFGWLTSGIRTPEGAQVMPAFGGRLSEEQRWALIDYVRAHNMGVARRQSGAWPVPLRAPGFEVSCGGQAAPLGGLHGRFVRLVVGAAGAVPAAADDVVTVGTVAAPAGGCTAADESVVAAYAIVAGVAPDALAGAQFLIDGDGWLRAMQAPGATMGWDDPKMLSAEVRQLRAHPVASGAAPAHMDMDMKM